MHDSRHTQKVEHWLATHKPVRNKTDQVDYFHLIDEELICKCDNLQKSKTFRDDRIKFRQICNWDKQGFST